MTQETNEDVRDVFTYSNFKKAIAEIKEIKAQNQEIETENLDIKMKN